LAQFLKENEARLRRKTLRWRTNGGYGSMGQSDPVRCTSAAQK
jgi:hypothetical protein